jgi:hypothetical protein
MPEQEPLQPQEIEADDWGEGWVLKSEGLLEPNYIEMPAKVEPGPPVYLVDGIAKPARWMVNGKHCYEQSDLDRYIKQLEKDGAKYTVEEVAPPAGFHVTKGVKYANVDEALKHMANAEPPESMIIPYLQEKIKANEDWLAAALTKLTEMETGKLTELSDKVQALEEAAVKGETIISKG